MDVILGITFWVLLIGFLLFGPSIILFRKGRQKIKEGDKDKAKVYYILAVVYLLISFGSCGGLIMNLKI